MGLQSSKPYIIDEIPSDDEDFFFDDEGVHYGGKAGYQSVPTTEEDICPDTYSVVANPLRFEDSTDQYLKKGLTEVDELMSYLNQSDDSLSERSSRHVDHLDGESSKRMDREEISPLLVPQTHTSVTSALSLSDDTGHDVISHTTEDSRSVEEKLKAMAALDRELRSFEVHEEESFSATTANEQHAERCRPQKRSGIPKLQSARVRSNSSCSDESDTERVKIRGRSVSPATPGGSKPRGSGIPRLGGGSRPPLVRLTSHDSHESVRSTSHFSYTTCDNCGVRIYTKHYVNNNYK